MRTKLSQFNFDLPKELVSMYPAEHRDESRLMVVHKDSGKIEHKLFKDALEQVELADRLGIDYAWEVEHHFLEEYSHSSAPEVFLGCAPVRYEAAARA